MKSKDEIITWIVAYAIGMVAGGIFLLGGGVPILFLSSKFPVENNYDFFMRGILLFLAMVCIGFGVHIFLRLFNRKER